MADGPAAPAPPDKAACLDASNKAQTFRDAHKLIEECMVLANVAVAQELRTQRQPALFRVHARRMKKSSTRCAARYGCWASSCSCLIR